MIAHHKMISSSDSDLVDQSLSGNRDAFGQIVARYQSLVCSLAYSATGNLTQSEDLAQETFLTAWKNLRGLREPEKLRSWLCGIARNLAHNSLRQQERDPNHAAESLENISESRSPAPLPHDEAISREEEAILWRSIESVPEIYREPLVLFYREHQSVEKVAAALELSEDAVKQRLSRGRKLLHEQVITLVESALERTNPGKAFTVGVLAALPAFTISAKAATLGATAAKGTGTAKAAAVTGLLGAVLSPLLAFFGTWIGYRMSLDSAQSDRERDFIRNFYRKLVWCIVAFFIAYGSLVFWSKDMIKAHSSLFVVSVIGLALAYAICIVTISIWSWRKRRELRAENGVVKITTAKPVREYRSALCLLGLPLVHIRIGGGFSSRQKPVKAWIAIGDCAIGGLFAFGGMAIAPFSMGGLAIGLLPFGGSSVGLLALGGFSIGVWSFGGLALGWQSFGGCAIAWNAAVGGAAVAYDFALGGIAQAAQANNEIATQFIQSNLFFRAGQIGLRYLPWINLLWLVPLFVWWRVVRRHAGK
jgi:RNA polymerase sigma factor (sigma-70 family)